MRRIPATPKRTFKCFGFRDRQTGEIITKYIPFIRKLFRLRPSLKYPYDDPNLKFLGCITLLSCDECTPELFEDDSIFPEE